jgi:acyl-coenzyme A thioesterase PaaI-like protein
VSAVAPHPFRSAVEAGDLEALAAALHPDVTLVDPLVGFTWRGRDRVLGLVRTLGRVFEDFEYVDELEGDGTRALRFRVRVGGHRIDGMDHLQLDENGLVIAIAIAMRPLASMQALAVRMAEHLPRLLAGDASLNGDDPGRRFRRAGWHGEAEASAGMSGVDYLRALRDGDLPAPPISALIGFRIDVVEEGRVTIVGEPTELHHDPVGGLSAGFTATLLDSVMGWAVHSALPADGGYTTLELRTSVLPSAGVAGGKVSCAGTMVHRAGGAAVAEGRLKSVDTGELLASATATYLVNEGLS